MNGNLPQTRKHSSKLPYFSKGALLSRGELFFYRALSRAVSSDFLIAPKVRVADLISCNEESWSKGFGHMVAKHHLDFVLCDPQSTAIRLVIELDDKSHALETRRSRDMFLNRAFRAAKIPLLRFRASSRYDARQIRSLIGDASSRINFALLRSYP